MPNFKKENGLVSTFCRKLLRTLICGKQYPTTKTCTPPRPPVFRSKFDHLIRGPDLLKLKEDEEEQEADFASPVTVQVATEQEIKNVVRRVQSGERKAVEDVRRLAKDNMEIRDMFGIFGVIPMLVSMVDCSEELIDQINVLYALLNVSVGHEMNKAAIANAGAIHTLVSRIESACNSPSPPPSKLYEVIIANLLSLSALDANKPILGLSCIIPILLAIVSSSNTTSICKQDSIRTLLNLSLLSTTTHLTHLLVPTFINLIGDPDINVYVLSILSNLVSTAEGRVAVSQHLDVLINVLTWVDAPLCQEKAVYILMAIGYKANYGGKAKMVDAGILHPLLELILAGTDLAQNYAGRLFEILTMDKGKDYIAVKRLVDLSLKENMRRIVKRANFNYMLIG